MDFPEPGIPSALHMGIAPSRDPGEILAWAMARHRELTQPWEDDPELAPENQREWYRRLNAARLGFEQEARQLELVGALESVGFMERSSILTNARLSAEAAPLLVKALPLARYTRFAILDALRRMKFAGATPALIEDYVRSRAMAQAEAKTDRIAAAIVACMTAEQRPLLIDLAIRLGPSGVSGFLIGALARGHPRPADRTRILELLRQWLPAISIEYLPSIASAARSLEAVELLEELRAAGERLAAARIPKRQGWPRDASRQEIEAAIVLDGACDQIADAKRRFPKLVAALERMAPPSGT